MTTAPPSRSPSAAYRSKEGREPVQDGAVHVALEGDDEVGKVVRLNPLPVAELGVVGRDIHVRVRAGEAREVPVLDLSLPFSAPQLRGDRVRDVILQPLGMIGDLFDQARGNAGFFL